MLDKKRRFINGHGINVEIMYAPHIERIIKMDAAKVYREAKEMLMKRINRLSPTEEVEQALEILTEYWEKETPPLGHGYLHALNTLFNLNDILEGYTHLVNVDSNLLYISALYHDVNRPAELHDGNGIVPNGELSAQTAQHLLDDCLSNQDLHLIVNIIKSHDMPTKVYDGLQLETMMLRLADINDIYPERVVACAYDYNERNGNTLTNELITLQWRKKYDADMNEVQAMKEYGLPVNGVREKYDEVILFLKDVLPEKNFPEIMRKCAMIEAERERAAKHAIFEFLGH